MIWLNIGVRIRLSVDQYIINLGLWTASIRLTTANKISISALSVVFHWCTKECGLKLFCYCCMNCCAYRLVCITMWSIICSVMYSLRKSYAVGFLGMGTGNFSSPVNFIFHGLNGSPEYILFHCPRKTIGWLCLGQTCLRRSGGGSGPILLCLCPAGACLAPLGSCLFLSTACWRLSSNFCPLFILSVTCWNLSNIFCTQFILFITCWGFSKTNFFIRYPSPCSSFIHYWWWPFFLLLLRPFVVVIRTEYVRLVRKVHLSDAGKHLDHPAQ